MTTAVTVQEKAITLREDLFSRKEQFQVAMPKWMTVERLLRIVFTTAMRNPKILDCTQQSIFGAVMQCAQLGLEPILGRAYLIPYNNNKLVDGRWQKVLECQFQPGYQGLIDLARRSDTVSDVYGFNVYEADEFDMSYGTDRRIHHKPWYMDPAKRGKEPGAIIGTYCVWVLKDGTIHPEFMYIDDIHKRREKSQAYQWAASGDKSKGGGKKDSVWHVWPEDMNLKTVVKHSSKMVPASIEFMTAVTYDNDAELGNMSFNHFLAGGLGAGPGLTEGDTQEPPDNKEVFDTMLAEKSVDKERMHEFVADIAKTYSKTTDEVIASAIGDIDKCLIEFRKWEGIKYKKKVEEPGLDKEEKTLADEIGKLKRTGLTGWEKANHDKIEGLSEEDKTLFLDKWHRVLGKGYHTEGQPGYKTPVEEEEPEAVVGREEKEGVTGEGEGGVVDAEFTGTPEEIRSAKLKVEFRKAMLTYKEDGDEGLGSAKFYQVLRVANFGEIEDVPESQYNNILQAMEDARFSD